MSVALQPSVSGAPPGMQLVKICHFSINNTNQVPLGPMLHPQCQVLPLLATLLINLPMQLEATNLAVREQSYDHVLYLHAQVNLGPMDQLQDHRQPMGLEGLIGPLPMRPLSRRCLMKIRA